jgi:hypothetical protein
MGANRERRSCGGTSQTLTQSKAKISLIEASSDGDAESASRSPGPTGSKSVELRRLEMKTQGARVRPTRMPTSSPRYPAEELLWLAARTVCGPVFQAPPATT